ncbi:hypothetical protein NBRC116595_26420 [Aliiglaciecola sp. NS0011-25]
MSFGVFDSANANALSENYSDDVLIRLEHKSISCGHILSPVQDTTMIIDLINTLYRFENNHELFITVVADKDTKYRQKNIENLLYTAGFHLEASEWFTRKYHLLTDSRPFATTTFRKIKHTGHNLVQMSNLLKERDLHMDMLREFSCRSDAHVYRYVFAQTYIRPGDKVLDCACGLGYGSYLLASNESARFVQAVDICEDSISYANQIYGNEHLNYAVLDIDEYANTDICEFDLITSFETIEHVKDYHSFFKLCLKSLKPDGRVIASVPYLWVDETGKDPNPYHFHEFDWQKFKALFLDYGFVIEARYHQSAPGGFKLPKAPRKFEKIDVDKNENDTEWLIIVATPDLTHPLWQDQQRVSYENPEYSMENLPKYLDFENGYDNPWLHRQIVQVGQRIEDQKIRNQYVSKLLSVTDCDTLMLRTVQGYALDSKDIDTTSQWISEVKTILMSKNSNQIRQNPFTLRWFISLSFLLAKQLYEVGSFKEAKQFFVKLLAEDCNSFCPILCIKSIESEYYLAKIALYQHDKEIARQHLVSGKKLIFEANSKFQQVTASGEDLVAAFLWPEMADLHDAGALLNQVLISIDSGARIPSILRQAEKLENNKRFGLFNLLQKYRSSDELTEQNEMLLVAKSLVNKLVIKVIDCNEFSTLYIWGTGIVAKEVFKQLTSKQIEVAGFVDTNTSFGQFYLEKPVIKPDQIDVMKIDLLVLTSVGSSDKIAESIPASIQCVYVA